MQQKWQIASFWESLQEQAGTRSFWKADHRLMRNGRRRGIPPVSPSHQVLPMGSGSQAGRDVDSSSSSFKAGKGKKGNTGSAKDDARVDNNGKKAKKEKSGKKGKGKKGKKNDDDVLDLFKVKSGKVSTKVTVFAVLAIATMVVLWAAFMFSWKTVERKHLYPDYQEIEEGLACELDYDSEEPEPLYQEIPKQLTEKTPLLRQ
eukprot:m.295435 g.295435  ORF g.295435 m.295435 type:complete len:203 (-) comp16393_c6_seq19:4706-5314(-)